MYKENHDNGKAVDALNHYLEANKGKDSAGEKRAQEEIQSLGGAAPADKKKPAPPKKK